MHFPDVIGLPLLQKTSKSYVFPCFTKWIKCRVERLGVCMWWSCSSWNVRALSGRGWAGIGQSWSWRKGVWREAKNSKMVLQEKTNWRLTSDLSMCYVLSFTFSLKKCFFLKSIAFKCHVTFGLHFRYCLTRWKPPQNFLVSLRKKTLRFLIAMEERQVHWEITQFWLWIPYLSSAETSPGRGHWTPVFI